MFKMFRVLLAVLLISVGWFLVPELAHIGRAVGDVFSSQMGSSLQVASGGELFGGIVLGGMLTLGVVIWGTRNTTKSEPK